MLTNQVSHDIDMLMEVRNGNPLQYFEMFRPSCICTLRQEKIGQSLLTLQRIIHELGLGLWCLTPFQQYFSYIVPVHELGVRN
jgi:hypothetical protein